MRRHRLSSPVVAALLATLAVACGAAWPGGYREAVCAASAHLLAADRELSAAVQGMTAEEPERVSVAATGMQREALAAAQALAAIPGWEPGAQLISDLCLAATRFAQAARLFATGARHGGGPALDRAVTTGQEAEAALSRAEGDADGLRDATGWQPC